jgi:hypothetical protein
MVSSQLQIDNRSSLYFNKYKFRAKCKIYGICYSYYTSNLDEFVNKLEGMEKNRSKYRISIINSRWEQTIDHINLEQIGKYFAWKKDNTGKEYMSRIQNNTISFFSDDLALLKTLTSVDPEAEFSEARVEHSDVIFFKNEPEYKFRTFFRGKKTPEGFYEDVKEFITSYGHIAKVCPALSRMALDPNPRYSYKYSYIHNSYFVDYNDESTLTLLYLHFGSMLAKTYRLEKEP